jgi:hypothetical protein
MYSARQFLKGLKLTVTDRNLLLREANRLYHTRLGRRSYNPDGVDVMDEDWDFLIVLDACRYDTFESQHTLPGHLQRRTSRGSHTSEFIRGNFHGRSFPDTTYVTASPILHRGLGELYETSFHDVVNVWAEDGWDDADRTVLPETMADYALEAAETYPNKRLVIHFMQPHYPFIGSDVLDDVTVPDPSVDEGDIWAKLMTGEERVPAAEVWQAYRDNLDRAMPALERLFDELSGKVVVTADHGNMIGERAAPVPVVEWGHPPRIHTPELVEVPWLEYDAGPRRDVRADQSSGERATVEESVVTDRLRQLGYAE